MVAAALAFPAGAAADPSYLDPVIQSAEGATASAPAVAVNAPGEVVALWSRDGVIQAAGRAPGQAAGAAQDLGPGGTPQIGVADDGTAVAAWTSGTGPVQYAIRAPGQGFGAAAAFDDGGSGTPADLQVTVNGEGDALVVWSRVIAGQSKAIAAFLPHGGAFQAPKVLSAGEGCQPDGALATYGHAVVVWREGGCGTPGAVRIARRTPSDTDFGASEEAVPVGEGATNPVVAMDQDAVSIVGWTGANPSGMRIAVAPYGQPVAGYTTISSADTTFSSPDVAVSASGERFASWLADGEGQPRPVLAHAPKGAAFEAPVDLTDRSVAASAPVLAVGAGGHATVGFLQGGAATSRQRRPDGSLLPVAAASQTGASAVDIAADDQGDAVIAYVQAARATVRAYDAGGPRIADVPTFFGVAEATVPLNFTMSAADTWSTVAGMSWDFGDGTTGPGPTTSHAYTQVGLKTFAALATDSLGNLGRFERQLYVFPQRDRTAPVITAFKMDRRRFKIGRKATAIAATAAGTRFRYTISEPLTAGILLQRETRRGKRKRYKTVGLITRKHPLAGKVSVGFTGRLEGRSGGLLLSEVRLTPGRYRAVVSGIDPSGNRSNVRRLRFVVTRR